MVRFVVVVGLVVVVREEMGVDADVDAVGEEGGGGGEDRAETT